MSSQSVLDWNTSHHMQKTSHDLTIDGARVHAKRTIKLHFDVIGIEIAPQSVQSFALNMIEYVHMAICAYGVPNLRRALNRLISHKTPKMQ
jgi:hypothetical protein